MRKLLPFALFFFISYAICDYSIISTHDSLAIYESFLNRVIKESFAELRSEIGLDLPEPVKFFLCHNSQTFYSFYGRKNDHITAFSSPEENKIIVNFQKISGELKFFKPSIKEELVFFLSREIEKKGNRKLPYWFLKGIGERITDGSTRRILGEGEEILFEAALFSQLLPLEKLDLSDRDNKKLLLLGSLESLTFIEYLENTFGKGIIAKLLKRTEKGENFYESLTKITGESLTELERNLKWHLFFKAGMVLYLVKRIFWLLLISGIIFFIVRHFRRFTSYI